MNGLSEPSALKRGQQEFRDDRIFYIGCDDRYAPDQYFGFFRMPRIKMCVIPATDNKSHARWVLEKLQACECEEDDERWMILDTDHCVEDSHFETYEKALSEARQQGIKVAISKPSFEVWLALHHIDFDALQGCTNAESVGEVLSDAIGGYRKTGLREDAFPLARVPDAYRRAKTRDIGIGGGDKPEDLTTRVYQVWHNILCKALAAQLPEEIKSLAEDIRISGETY